MKTRMPFGVALAALGVRRFGQNDPPEPSQAVSGTFTANANGRFTGTLNIPQAGPINLAFYIVDSS